MFLLPSVISLSQHGMWQWNAIYCGVKSWGWRSLWSRQIWYLERAHFLVWQIKEASSPVPLGTVALPLRGPHPHDLTPLKVPMSSTELVCQNVNLGAGTDVHPSTFLGFSVHHHNNNCWEKSGRETVILF